MLADRTNLPPPASSTLKRAWTGEGDNLRLKAKLRLASSSSPASAQSSSLFSEDNTLGSQPSSPSALNHKQLPSSPVPKLALSTLVPVYPQSHTLAHAQLLQFGRKITTKSVNPTRLEPTLVRIPINLPRHAKHASRLHCTAQLIPSTDKMMVRVKVNVLGQNGIKIDGRVHGKGVVCLMVPRGGEMTLDFWGWEVRIEMPRVVKRVVNVLVKTIHVVKERNPLPLPPPPPRLMLAAPVPVSSPMVTDESSSSSEEDEEEDESIKVKALLVVPAAVDELAVEEDETEEDDDDDDEEDDAVTSRPSPHERAVSPAISLLSSLCSSSPIREFNSRPLSLLPSRTQDVSDDDEEESPTPADILASSLSLDLPGLIASAIVFHPRSTVGVEEVVRALLKEVGGMWDILPAGRPTEGAGAAEKEVEAVEAWWECIEDVLREEKMFGCIENVGLRDAAGNPLSPAFYYSPELDRDRSRVAALEPFCKRVRGARTAGGGKQYFWKKPAVRKW